MKRWLRGVVIGLLCSVGVGAADPPADPMLEQEILRQIQLMNQIPQIDLSEKVDPAFSILRKLYDKDGPDFLILRKLLSQANVRSTLNPSTRYVFGNVLSQRWDTFTLSGNLFLSGLQSENGEIRSKARKKLVGFIQPAHVSPLIELLDKPGPNVLAYEVLQEVTGKSLAPSKNAWRQWWTKEGSKVDLIGHLLNDTRRQLASHTIRAFDPALLWYAPKGITNTKASYMDRPEREQQIISEWNAWIRNDVKRYTDDWAVAKPLLDRIAHQPDPRIDRYFQSLVLDPGYGDYASVILGWRAQRGAVELIKDAFDKQPSVGRALARGALGDRGALVDLLRYMGRFEERPLSFPLMDDDARSYLSPLRTVGVVPAEQAFELLCHQNFNFDDASTSREKKKAFKAAHSWLLKNAKNLALDRRRGYYTTEK